MLSLHCAPLAMRSRSGCFQGTRLGLARSPVVECLDRLGDRRRRWRRWRRWRSRRRGRWCCRRRWEGWRRRWRCKGWFRLRRRCPRCLDRGRWRTGVVARSCLRCAMGLQMAWAQVGQCDGRAQLRNAKAALDVGVGRSALLDATYDQERPDRTDGGEWHHDQGNAPPRQHRVVPAGGMQNVRIVGSLRATIR